MKKIKETEKGFYGCYWPVEGSRCAILAMLGDDCEDYMAKSAVKWLQKKFQVSVLTLSPAHKDYSHHNLPVERIGADRYRPSYHTGCGCVENRIIQDKKNRQAGGRCYYVNRDRGCCKKIWQRRE